MEDELRNWLIATYGMNAWNDILRIQAKLRKERQEEIARKKKEREEILKLSIVVLIIIFVAVFGLTFYFSYFT
ncbi:MAG TPA: hypothetical protein DCM40_16670 [Maribacter sp.]|nr:hypothetical protein [Maribacter sp.]